MENKFVITVSHQLGCGGAEVGKKLAERLSVPFVDRQILKMVADSLHIPVSELESREERKTSFWEAFLRLEALADPTISLEDGPDYPSDRTLLELEKKYILEIAGKGSAVFLGRGCRYYLRDVHHHLRVFVCADMSDRIKRVSELYQSSERDAEKLIERNDRERSQYMRQFSGLDWLDARAYDVCVNTSSAGIDNAAEIIERCLKSCLSKS